jgi:predicted phosphodiesterase
MTCVAQILWDTKEISDAEIMRYLVFGDVHANFDGLSAVLREGEKRGVDAHLFLGDLVGYGPDPLECVQRVMELQKAGSLAWVAGNHELVVRGDLVADNYSAEAQTTLAWTRKLVEAAPWALKFLESAPLTAKVNGSIWLTHESLVNPGSGRYNREPQEAYPELMALAEKHGRVCFYGHTHRQRAELLDHSKKLLAVEMEPHEGVGKDTEPLNLDGGMLAWIGVGSAGFPVSKKKGAEFLIVDDEDWHIEKYAIPYPRERVKARAVEVLTPVCGPEVAERVARWL